MRIVRQRKAWAIQGDSDSKKQNLGMSTWLAWAQARVPVSSISKLTEAGGKWNGVAMVLAIVKADHSPLGCIIAFFLLWWKYLEWVGLEGVSCSLPQSDQWCLTCEHSGGNWVLSLLLWTWRLFSFVCVWARVCRWQRIMTKERSSVWESEAGACEG